MSDRKPSLTREEKRLLKIKNEQGRKRPAFRRQEWFRYKKFDEVWRKPRGMHSKLREHLSWRPPNVDAGYRSPRAVRGLHPSGFREVMVYNPADLEKIDVEKEAGRISSKVGSRKRIMILEKADELGVKLLNRGEN
ncbi:MAG: 50S ribosomal protein L32e [Thermoplasmataceae archaeon]